MGGWVGGWVDLLGGVADDLPKTIHSLPAQANDVHLGEGWVGRGGGWGVRKLDVVFACLGQEGGWVGG